MGLWKELKELLFKVLSPVPSAWCVVSECYLLITCLVACLKIIILIWVCFGMLGFLSSPPPTPRPRPPWKYGCCWRYGGVMDGGVEKRGFMKNVCLPSLPRWSGIFEMDLCVCICWAWSLGSRFILMHHPILRWLREARALPEDWDWWHTVTSRPEMAQGIELIFCLSYAWSLWQSKCLLSEWARNCPLC